MFVRYCSPCLPMWFEVFDVDVVRSCGVVVFAVFDGCLYLFCL